ncbi:MAG: ABC transporter permease [Mycobacterium sp.]
MITKRAARPGELPKAGAAPAILIALFFTLAPILLILAYSFLSQGPSGSGATLPITFDNYERLLFQQDFYGNSFFDPRYLSVIGTSFAQAATTMLVCLLIGFPTALWIAMQPPKRQTVLILLVSLPFWTNVLVRVYAWILLLNNKGVINGASETLGFGVHQLLYTNFASTIGLIYSFLPFMILPLHAALSGFDFRLAEAAYDLGAGKFTVMRRIILPAAKGGLISGILLVLIPAFGSFIQPVLLGGGKVLLVGNLIEAQFGIARNWPFGAALSILVLALLLVGLMVVSVAARRTGTTVEVKL